MFLLCAFMLGTSHISALATNYIANGYRSEEQGSPSGLIYIDGSESDVLVKGNIISPGDTLVWTGRGEEFYIEIDDGMPIDTSKHYSFNRFYIVNSAYSYTRCACLMIYQTLIKVNYDANGGTTTVTSQSSDPGMQTTVTDVKPTREGYTFKGWADSEAPTVAKYQSGDLLDPRTLLNEGAVYTKNSHKMETTVNLVAVWEEDSTPDPTPNPTPTPDPTPAQVQAVEEPEEFSEGGYNYKILDKEAKTVAVTGIENKNAKSVKVAATVNKYDKTYTITEIAPSAFSGMKKLTKATIGANVIIIGDKAFFKCTKLKNLTVQSKNLKKVGANCLKKTKAGIKISIKVKLTNKKFKAFKKKFKKCGAKNPKYIKLKK